MFSLTNPERPVAELIQPRSSSLIHFGLVGKRKISQQL
jgi:hypothetical protein